MLRTGDEGLEAIDRVGGPAHAFFALDHDGESSEAAGERAAKIRRQLIKGPKSGGVLFEETEVEDGRSRPARGRVEPREFDEYLRSLVQHRRLHVAELGQLSPGAAREIRADLKAALSEFNGGQGGIEPLLHQVERVAKYVSGDHKRPLGKAGKATAYMVQLFAAWAVRDTGLPGMPWRRLYEEVWKARNDIAHTGTEAVLAGTRTSTLATVLLDALVGVAKGGAVRRVRDVMVANPVCAHGWQTVADIRRTMLINDYSGLPVVGKASEWSWKTVTATGLAAYLTRDRTARLGRRLDQATQEERDPLCLDDTPTVGERTPVRELWGETEGKAKLPAIVCRCGEEGPIVIGIVTSFDLL